MENPARRYIIVEELARLVFKELDPDLWHYMWYECEGRLDEFLEVLFLVYFAHGWLNALEWFYVGLYDLNSHA
jgi:hypothetical protein